MKALLLKLIAWYQRSLSPGTARAATTSPPARNTLGKPLKNMARSKADGWLCGAFAVAHPFTKRDPYDPVP